MGVSPGNDQSWSQSKIEANRNFANKIWNMARYVQDKVEGMESVGAVKPRTTADHWVLNKLQQTTTGISGDLEAYRYAEAYDKLYHFVWDDVADWYIEASKADTNAPLLVYVLQSVLQMAHPFAPFVTETIWQTLDWADGKLLTTSGWPEDRGGDAGKAQLFETVRATVGEVRYITKALHVTKPTLYYRDKEQFFKDNGDLIAKLAGLEAVVAAPAEAGGLHLTQVPYDCWLDISRQKRKEYLAELEVKRQGQEAVIARLKGRLDNDAYVRNAPKEMVQQTEEQLDEARQLLENMTAEAERFAA
jgi:valyl-tRNA synthetase